MLSLTRPRNQGTSFAEPERRAGALDALAVALFAIAAAWLVWASAESGGSPVPGVELLVACGIVIVAARTIGSRTRVLVPVTALLAAVLVAAGSKTGLSNSAPLSGPLEYTNADGAFYVQAAIAALMIAFIARPWLLRMLGGIGAAAFAALPFVIHAAAAALLVIVLPGIALVSAAIAGAKGARASVVLLGVLFVTSLGASIWLGGSYSGATRTNVLQRAAIQTVGEHRLILWHDAFQIMERHLAIGVGPGRYQVVRSVYSRNPDFRWAHNEFLQQGAEGGIPGLLLLGAIFVWGFARLSVGRAPDVVTALGAASLAALGIHACIDYVVHFPAIPLMAAGLVATGMAGVRRRT